MIATLALLFAPRDLSAVQALLAKGDMAGAQAALDPLLAANPTSVPALLLQGRLAMAMGNPDRARDAFSRATVLAPSSANAWFLLGFFHYTENDFTRALPALESASRLDANDPRTMLFLALTHDGLAHTEQALDWYRRAVAREIATGRRNTETLTAFARFLFTLGRFDESRARVEDALKLDPRSREAHYELARILAETGRHAEAAQSAERAVELAGAGVTDRQIHHLLARVYAKLGQAEKAAHHRRAMEAIPPRLVR